MRSVTINPPTTLIIANIIAITPSRVEISEVFSPPPELIIAPIIEIPEMGPNLEYLNCDINQLTALPAMSTNLKKLFCSYIQLTVLPEMGPNWKVFGELIYFKSIGRV